MCMKYLVFPGKHTQIISHRARPFSEKKQCRRLLTIRGRHQGCIAWETGWYRLKIKAGRSASFSSDSSRSPSWAAAVRWDERGEGRDGPDRPFAFGRLVAKEVLPLFFADDEDAFGARPMRPRSDLSSSSFWVAHAFTFSVASPAAPQKVNIAAKYMYENTRKTSARK